MLKMLSSWLLVGIIVPLLIGVGFSVMSMNPPAYNLAEVLLSAAALFLSAKVGWWIAYGQSDGATVAYRLVLSFILFGAIGMLWVWSLAWVNTRIELALQAGRGAQSQPEVTIGKSAPARSEVQGPSISDQRQIDPVIHIEPEVGLKKSDKGTNGIFTLTLENSGLVDVSHVEILNDFFVAQKQPDLVLTRIGGFSILPDIQISYLKSRARANFKVDLSKVIGLMWTFAAKSNLPNVLCVRVMVKYRRAVDGKEYKLARGYGVAGPNGELLYTPDARGIGMPPDIRDEVLTLDEVIPYLQSGEEKP